MTSITFCDIKALSFRKTRGVSSTTPVETENAIPSTEQSDWNSFQIFLSHFTHHCQGWRHIPSYFIESCRWPWQWVSTPTPAIGRWGSRPARRPWRMCTPALAQRATTSPTTAWKSLKSVRFKSVFSHHSYTLGTTKLLNRFASLPTHKTFLAESMEGNSSHELIWIWYLFQFFTIKFSAVWILPDFLCILSWVGFCCVFLSGKTFNYVFPHLPTAFLQR